MLTRTLALAMAVLLALLSCSAWADAPVPLLSQGKPVDWWFVFKFNAKSFPGCGQDAPVNSCPFGGELQNYKPGFSQQFVYASSADGNLKQGSSCVGAGTADPVGATFDEIYNGTSYFVVWNDQFYSDPKVANCGDKSCNEPWGHSKGVLAWDDDGNGLVMQVSTPSWPGAGNQANPRQSSGNTLGCIKTPNDVEVSQHFFALRLNKSDLAAVLMALRTASVVTDPGNAQIVRNGGPTDIQALVASLGARATTKTVTSVSLSSGVRVIAKPSRLQVPPWQLISAELGGIPLRVATWWESDKPDLIIPSTTSTGKPDCWDDALDTPGPVTNSDSGTWAGSSFSLTGGLGMDHNHAKVGVSLSDADNYVIFGDMNQEGALSGNCKAGQNGRGGVFFVLGDAQLKRSVAALIAGNEGQQ